MPTRIDNITPTVNEVIGLGAALDGKADASALSSHTGDTDNPHEVTAAQVGAYTTTQVDGLISAITYSDVGAAAASHTHAIGQVDGLQTALDGKARQLYYDVRDYGATGDGTTDDTAAIQAALDAAASAGGGTVFLPRGTYLVSGTIYLSTDVTLEGVGSGSLLYLDDNAELDELTISSTARPLWHAIVAINQDSLQTNITLRNFALDANGDNQPSQTTAAILISNCDGFLCENLVSINCNYGIPILSEPTTHRAANLLIADASNGEVRGGRFEKSGYECIGVRSGGTRIKISGVSCINGKRHGLALQPGSSLVSVGPCSIDNRDSTELGKGLTIDGPHDCVITGVVCFAKTHGLHIFNGSSRVQVAACWFTVEEGGKGLHVGSQMVPAEDVTVTACHFAVNAGSNDQTRAIYIEDAHRTRIFGGSARVLGGSRGVPVRIENASDTVVYGVSIEGDVSADQGIQVFSGSSGTLVEANIIRMAADTPNAYPIQVSSTATRTRIARNNVVQSNRGIRVTTSAGATTIIEGNDLSGVASGPLAWIEGGTNIRIRDNVGAITEARGTAIIETDATSVTVTHGIDSVPAVPLTIDMIRVTPSTAMGNATQFWISDVGTTTFKINVDVAPGQEIGFVWEARLS